MKIKSIQAKAVVLSILMLAPMAMEADDDSAEETEDLKASKNFDATGFDFQIAPGPVQPTVKSLGGNYHCPDWFRDAKFGI